MVRTPPLYTTHHSSLYTSHSSLAQLVKDREETKQAIAQAAKDVFMKRYYAYCYTLTTGVVCRYDLADWSGSILAQCTHESLRVPTSLPNNRSVQPAKQATDWDSTQVGGARACKSTSPSGMSVNRTCIC